MNRNKKVTMIMPCFNSAPYLDYMLQSIYDQTYDNIELIIAYDDSTDGTLNILKNWKEKFDRRKYEYKIVRNPARAGIIGGINTALPYFTGDYITFPDSDDYLYPEFAEIMVNALDNNPDYGWARCDNIKVIGRDISFDNSGVADFNSETEYGESYDFAYDERYAHLGSVMNFILYTIPRAPWRMMCRREFLFEAIPDGSFYAHPSSHELPIALPLANKGEFYYVNKPLYKYTIHNDGYYNSRMQDLHKVIPYFDSMQQLAADCIKNLDVSRESRDEYLLANDVYYYSTKAYYATLHKAEKLAEKYALWLKESMVNFAGEKAFPANFPYKIFWKHFYKLAPKIVAEVKLDEDKEKFNIDVWEKIKSAKNLILYGAGHNCGEVVPMLDDLNIKIEEIWDSKAGEMGFRFGKKTDVMHTVDDKDTCIIITILNKQISDEVVEELARLGLHNIVLAKDLDLALKYGMLEKYFSWIV